MWPDVVVRGITIPGPYVMSFTTDAGEALAEGLVVLRSPDAWTLVTVISRPVER